jgi:hypothetical protein
MVSNTKWAVHITDDAKALRHVLNSHYTGIQMLINIHLVNLVSALQFMGSSATTQLHRQIAQTTNFTRNELSTLEARLAQNMGRAATKLESLATSKTRVQETRSMVNHSMITSKIDHLATFSQVSELRNILETLSAKPLCTHSAFT